MVVFLGVDLLDNPDDLSDCESESRAVESAVPVVCLMCLFPLRVF